MFYKIKNIDFEVNIEGKRCINKLAVLMNYY